ncbi:selenide, water dikinase SelD [Streptosporangium sp. 'caverna']|uniref:selenide, water dikinase SelD n=1 Tax=Streptosporangium sp. 'caverna' TaxID=2202249 RepID=UPI000D7E4984|nr:selenide, water dikinase SelD [Streptosporangium sp. 'caverna']AWS43668.1 selenide, water dikinase SelD [Streptosporangium sp. 'caverna']
MTIQEAVSLTQYSPGGGCACKMPQHLLGDVLSTMRGDGLLAAVSGPLRVGMDPADDAAVYDLNGRSMVFTCDFLTPVVDDPYDWGRIAAVNALSDVYAMGGRPLVALNILAWPADLDRELLAEVMRGGATAVSEAGALLAGGHSITDPAPKYGLAVVGDVDRDTILLKGGGRAGDVLVLTKPLGTGIVGTAVKRGEAEPTSVRAAVQAMTRLNADAAAVARAAGLSGGTDVTGYGLIGHLHEMALAAGIAARVQAGEVPLLPGVADLIERGCVPDGTRRTLAGALKEDWFDPGPLPHSGRLLIADAQTSGGLLLAVKPEHADTVVTHLRDRGDEAAVIVGDLVAGAPGTVSVKGGHQ